MARHYFCDRLPRRDFIKAGALGGLGLSLASYLRLAHAGDIAPAKGRSAIFIYLTGGPSHIDTFDLKPSAPSEIRGEFKPIKTNVAGMEICEHMPKLAQCADKYAILRGVSHSIAAHNLGTDYMNTGNRPLPSLDYPSYGAVVSKELPGRPGCRRMSRSRTRRSGRDISASNTRPSRRTPSRRRASRSPFAESRSAAG